MRLLAAVLLIFSITTASFAEEAAPVPEPKQYEPPTDAELGLAVGGPVLFWDNFDDSDRSQSTWIESSNSDVSGHFEFTSGSGPFNFAGDNSLVLPELARKYAVSARLPGGSYDLNQAPGGAFALYYTVQFTNDWTCTGAYAKLLAAPSDSATFGGPTPYSIMFGPDKCGGASKIHFIFRRQHPVTKQVQEHAISAPPAGPTTAKDGATHSFGLVVEGGKYTIYMDGLIVKSGDFATPGEFKPELFDPKEIDDPSDVKPSQDEWDEREKIADPKAEKPADWDNEQPEIADPEAVKPGDWDDDVDGDWEAPLIPNPEYRGEWTAPLVANPAFKGRWSPRKIQNPDFFDFSSRPNQFLPIDAVGWELWAMNSGLVFDNLFIAVGPEALAKMQAISRHYYEPRKKIEQAEIARKAAESQSGLPYSLNEIVKLAQDNPLMAAMAGVGAAMPILFLVFMCTGGSSSDTKRPAPKPTKKKEKVEEEQPKKEEKVVGTEEKAGTDEGQNPPRRRKTGKKDEE